jgi:hypothetical protein
LLLRFQNTGGESRRIPERHDLKGFVSDYLDEAGIAAQNKDRPLPRLVLFRRGSDARLGKSSHDPAFDESTSEGGLNAHPTVQFRSVAP